MYSVTNKKRRRPPGMAEGTTPWMEEVEPRRERRPRAMQEQLPGGVMISRDTPSYFQSALVALVALIVTAPALAAESHWWMREGKGDQLCETLYKELQKYRPEDLGSCTGSVALALPGMKEMEGWKELDPREHKQLFKKIQQYQALGAQAYFGKWPENAELRRTLQGGAKQKTISDENLEKRFQSFLAMGGRMRVKTLQLFQHPLHRPDITYEQPQTLLELRTKWYRTDCPKSPSLNDAVETFYITSDLSGPDPGILDGERSEASNAQIVVYKDAIYLMYISPGGDGIMFSRESSYWDLQRTCVIQR